MNKLSVAALLFLFISLAACTREKIDKITPQLLGTWKVERTVYEYYHPIHTLESREDIPGLPGDSIVFKANGLLYAYEDGDTEGEEVEYKVIDNNTIRIEYEKYEIKKLTATEFILYADDIDKALDERDVFECTMKR